MKKIFFIAFAALGVLSLASCLGDASDSNNSGWHEAAVVSPSNNQIVSYADNLTDTIWVASTDSWTASTSVSWLTIKDSTKTCNITYKYGYIYTSPIIVNTTPNTEGKRRSGIISINVSFTDGNGGALGVYYYQFPVIKVDNTRLDENTYTYTQTAADSITNDTLVFNTREAWTLTSDNSNVKFDTEEVSNDPAGKYITYKVHLNVTPNLTTDSVKTNLKLKSSSGIVTPITYIQKPKKN